MQPGYSLAITTANGPTHGIFSPVDGTQAAIVMVAGAGGGVDGPAGVYESLAQRLQQLGIAALRLDYRRPSKLTACVADLRAGIAMLQQQGIVRLVLVGWSFGGAVVIIAGVQSSIVVGVATIASQTYGTDDVADLAPKSLLLIHGAADSVLSADCSRDLYRRANEPKELVLYAGDGHGIELHSAAMRDLLSTWSLRLLSPGRDQAANVGT